MTVPTAFGLVAGAVFVFFLAGHLLRSAERRPRWNLFGIAVIVAAFSLLPVMALVEGIQSGTFDLRGERIADAWRDPVLFWALACLYHLASLCGLSVGLSLLIRMLRKGVGRDELV